MNPQGDEAEAGGPVVRLEDYPSRCTGARCFIPWG